WGSAAPGVSVRGEHFRVEDASIEPRPERQIPIWLGVYGRRALGVAARLADGWIPSMPFASPERFVTLRDRLLTAAEEAGRDPGEITLAYNVGVQIQEGRVADERSVAGGVAEVTDRLGDLIQRLGLGALSLWIRGEEQRQRFAEGILPALRR
ncbi:MAG TPA: LLM class flavin-dependent oxidoreductase, partial [Actinomycetota bacterium]|nr:LLM class flavin-dependent oxidoreductase [Actinomycetota bacterium]